MDAHSIALPGTFPNFYVNDLTFSTKQQRDRCQDGVQVLSGIDRSSYTGDRSLFGGSDRLDQGRLQERLESCYDIESVVPLHWLILECNGWS